MALVEGQSRTDPVTGVCGRIFTEFTLRASYSGMVASATVAGEPARDALTAILDAVGAGVYGALVSDAVVTWTVPADAFGPGIPPAPVTLTGSIT